MAMTLRPAPATTHIDYEALWDCLLNFKGPRD
jgi:hypothetical protein